ncbi:MAG: hypothetical protein AAF664_09970 [Planctomycetota bacterium]
MRSCSPTHQIPGGTYRSLGNLCGMIPLRRRSANKETNETLDWSSLLSLLEDGDRRAAVEVLYPEEGRESFLSMLRRISEELRPPKDAPSLKARNPSQPVRGRSTLTAFDVLAAGRLYESAKELSGYPTVAVAGMLNSGKTSLVASLLSPEGRRRTLRGSSNDEGTHRFVMWFPEAWKKNSSLWSLWMQRIGDAIGEEPELLAESAEEAHRQYNNRVGDATRLAVPLIATDPRLDEHGLGLLDCPDIVSDEAFGLGSPAERHALLSRAAKMCSAFIVVTGAESARDATLGELLRVAADLMPGVPRYLAVNKVRPRQTPDQVFATFSGLQHSFGVNKIYAAYDFEIPASRAFIPRSSVEGKDEMDDDREELLPIFFEVAESAEENPPSPIEDARLLSHLPDNLDRGQLQASFSRSHLENIRRVVREEAFHLIEEVTEGSQKRTDAAQDALLAVTLDYFGNREIGGHITELRLHQSRRIIDQLTQSFIASAPWYARWSVRLNAKVQNVVGGAKNVVGHLLPTASAKQAAEDLRGRFAAGELGNVITPDRLVRMIEEHSADRRLPHWPSLSSDGDDTDNARIHPWLDAARMAIDRFERDDFTGLDTRRLDEATTKMWSEVSLTKKIVSGLTPLGALLATFGGVLTLPVDMGTTFIASASISELLLAGGLTAAATAWAGNQSTRDVEQQAARQQVADFHAVLCDTFGVAREDKPRKIRVADTEKRLPLARIIIHTPHGPTLRQLKLREEFVDSLASHFPE